MCEKVWRIISGKVRSSRGDIDSVCCKWSGHDRKGDFVMVTSKYLDPISPNASLR